LREKHDIAARNKVFRRDRRVAKPQPNPFLPRINAEERGSILALPLISTDATDLKRLDEILHALARIRLLALQRNEWLWPIKIFPGSIFLSLAGLQAPSR
jgi:hypothetical protein